MKSPAAFVASLVLTSSTAFPQASTTLVSGSPTGTPGDAHSTFPGVSADGRYVSFSSGAYNLVPGAGHWAGLVYLHDLWTHSTVLGNPADNGSLSNAGYYQPSLTATGRQVVFATAAPLLGSDLNGVSDIYFSDLDTGALELISVSTTGIQGNSQSIGPRVTSDGRYVAFSSLASTLIPGDSVNSNDVFVRDRMTGVTELISVNLDGEPAWGTEPSISADGRYVAFSSPGNDLVAGDANGFVYDVFVRDRVAGKTALVSIRADGVQGDGHSGGFSFGNEYDQAISADGRYIAFRSYAQNLVPGDQFSADILIKDMWSGSLVAASISAAGQFSGEDSFGPRISADGRLVAFTSRASNLVPGDTNNQEDVFVRDMLTGAFERLNVNLLNAQANGWAFEVGMSADGRRIAFGSPATDLVPSHYGSSRDIFLRTRALDVPQTYCAASANSLGCTPAIGFSGAPSFSGQTPFQVDASAVISHKLGRLVYSTAGSNDTAFAGGLLCLRAPLRWTAVQLSGGNSGLHDCSGTLLFDFGAWIASGRDLALTAGRQVWTQWFTRDGGASSTLSLSGGLTFVIEP